MIQYSGFADEAGISIASQIKATRRLGWSLIESRKIGFRDLATISDLRFRYVEKKLSKEGVRIHCFGSSIANWGRSPLKEKDFQRSLKEMRRVIPRMKSLGTAYVRGMSFAIMKERDPWDPELERHVFRKVGELVKICEDNGIIYLHENCMNYGGQSSDHTLKLLDKVNSPALRLVFDTGNPVHSWDRRDNPPIRKQNSFEFYSQVREFIHHVHIKDCIWKGEGTGVFDKAEHTFPGEGDGQVREIIRDLLISGYDGVLSIEPHLGPVFHERGRKRVKFSLSDQYVEYGRRLMSLVEDEEKSLNIRER